MRTKVNSLTIYEDVKEILDAAVMAGGGTFTLDSHGAAVHWRQRAYKFRKAFRETTTRSVYDRLTLPQVAKDSCDVIIRVMEQKGTFTPTSNPVMVAQTSEPMTPEEDVLLAHAKALAADIDGDPL